LLSFAMLIPSFHASLPAYQRSHFSFHRSRVHRDLHSFPTRRSSDLEVTEHLDFNEPVGLLLVAILHFLPDEAAYPAVAKLRDRLDRKSTRLNSSHVKISYAVFCLKKKREENINHNKIIRIEFTISAI